MRIPKRTSNKFSTKYIGNEVVPLISETPSSEDNFETKLQAKFEKSDQFLSKIFDNKVITLNSEISYSEDNFEGKFQSNITPSNQIFEQPEEELIKFKGKQQMEPNKLS